MNSTFSVKERAAAVGVPTAFAVLSLAHPMQDPWELGDAVGRWMLVHAGQLVMTVLLAYVLWFLLAGIESRSARLMRVVLPVFLVAFSAFDAVAGLATGWLALRADDQSGAAREQTLVSVEYLFADNWLAGNLSVLGGVTAVAWMTIAISAAVALRSAGADRLTVAAMSAAVLFASHPAPLGTIGLVALAVAAWRWTSGRRAQVQREPTRLEPVTKHSAVDRCQA